MAIERYTVDVTITLGTFTGEGQMEARGEWEGKDLPATRDDPAESRHFNVYDVRWVEEPFTSDCKASLIDHVKENYADEASEWVLSSGHLAVDIDGDAAFIYYTREDLFARWTLSTEWFHDMIAEETCRRSIEAAERGL